MRKEVEITETKTVYQYVCDLCEKDIDHMAYRHYQCEGCKKDMCSTCTDKWDYCPWTGDYQEGWPIWVCGKCKELAGPFSQKARAIVEKADSQVEELESQWRVACGNQ